MNGSYVDGWEQQLHFPGCAGGEDKIIPILDQFFDDSAKAGTARLAKTNKIGHGESLIVPGKLWDGTAVPPVQNSQSQSHWGTIGLLGRCAVLYLVQLAEERDAAFQSQMKTILESIRPGVAVGIHLALPVKSAKETLSEAIKEHNKDPFKIKDMNRCIVTCQTAAELLQIVRAIDISLAWSVMDMSNDFAKDSPAFEIRTISMHVMHQGSICEVQLMTAATYQMREALRPYYGLERLKPVKD